MLEPTRTGRSPRLIRGPFELTRDALLALHATNPQRYPVLLESAAASTALGRHDVLFALPGERLVLEADGTLRAPSTLPAGGGYFLERLDAWWQQDRIGCDPNVVPAGLPFAGGWFLFLSYELAGEVEPTLSLPRPSRLPVAEAVRIPAAIVRERANSHAWVVAEPSVGERDMASLVSDIEAADDFVSGLTRPSEKLLDTAVVEEPPEYFLESVERVLEHIGAGDIYQANLSRGWRARLGPEVGAVELYRRLRQTNPGPFAALAALEGRTIVSSSPERLVSVRDGVVATRPIAGTRPRGATAELDAELVQELKAHPKERAEHVMLLDLERNDLGRICLPGTVEVDEYMVIETYAHVHHIVSNVRGRLLPDATPGEVIRAVFPGGTITGCPKVRCMEIIGALEGEARGAYTGSLGYLNLDGSMDLNILIRTIELSGRDLTLRAGAGIVADSDPQRELEETRAKALGLLRALTPGRDSP